MIESSYCIPHLQNVLSRSNKMNQLTVLKLPAKSLARFLEAKSCQIIFLVIKWLVPCAMLASGIWILVISETWFVMKIWTTLVSETWVILQVSIRMVSKSWNSWTFVFHACWGKTWTIVASKLRVMPAKIVLHVHGSKCWIIEGENRKMWILSHTTYKGSNTRNFRCKTKWTVHFARLSKGWQDAIHSWQPIKHEIFIARTMHSSNWCDRWKLLECTISLSYCIISLS
jgi:hypothetical protein